MTDSVNAERQTQMLMSRHILKLKRHVNTPKEEKTFLWLPLANADVDVTTHP